MVRLAGIDAFGQFNEKQLSEIYEDLKLYFRLFHGPDHSLEPGDPDLQLIESISPEIRLLWSGFAGAYWQAYVSTATGAGLDKAVKIVLPAGRKAAVKATGAVTFSRTAAAPAGGIAIPAGTIVETAAGIRFSTDAQAVIPQGDTSITTNVTAVTAGSDGNVFSATITALVSSVSGVDSVTNSAGTTGGAELESDEALRARAIGATGAQGKATVNAIRSALINITDVRAAQVIVNDSDLTVDGNAPHSIHAYVLGGANQDIINTLGDSIAAGIKTNGSVTGSFTDDGGNVHTLKFSRPTEKVIYLDITVKTDDDWDAANGPDAIRDAVVQYVGGTNTDGQIMPGLDMADDVLRAEIVAAIMGVTGVENITSLKIDTVVPPVSTTGDITIGATEIARAETASGIDISTV